MAKEFSLYSDEGKRDIVSTIEPLFFGMKSKMLYRTADFDQKLIKRIQIIRHETFQKCKESFKDFKPKSQDVVSPGITSPFGIDVFIAWFLSGSPKE